MGGAGGEGVRERWEGVRERREGLGLGAWVDE